MSSEYHPRIDSNIQYVVCILCIFYHSKVNTQIECPRRCLVVVGTVVNSLLDLFVVSIKLTDISDTCSIIQSKNVTFS